MPIRARTLSKSFGTPPTSVLKDITLEIGDGELVAITGRSGSGKSTLLYILSSLDLPSSGEVEIDGRELRQMSPHELHRFRNRNLGFVFQFHYLLPELSSLENVLMPARKAGMIDELRGRAVSLLREVGLEGKEDRLPSQLSGGEQQRVAIARALVMEPRYVFADEPTGNLDSVSGAAVMELLKRVNRERRATVVFVTHDQEFANQAQRRIQLTDGKLAP